MQNKITQSGNLLTKNGQLKEAGYSTSMVLDYNRENIGAPAWKIKEWDYYLITNENYGVALTLADNGYMGLISISLLEFKTPSFQTTSRIIPFPLGRLSLPKSSQIGDVCYKNKDLHIEFQNDGKIRRLRCKMPEFKGKDSFVCDFILKAEPAESMVIATPFRENPLAFYYNQKIVGFKVRGYARWGDKAVSFKDKETRGILDWGRGVWTYKNTWYWGAAAGIIDGIEIGFNIGYGFGDTTAATENMIFYEGKAHKLDQVTFHIPVDALGNEDYLRPWQFTSNDGRFEMQFKPILDRKDYTNLGLLCSDQHQVFGKFTGSMHLKDGKVVEVKDLLGFAEKVKNRW